MEVETMSDMLTAVAIIFIVAGPFLLVANRFGIPPAPLLILAGIVAGGYIDEALAIELAQYGIALLVFFFGVGIQLSAIEPVITDSEIAAGGQIVVLGLLGAAFGLVVGLAPGEAFFVGVATALSSTLVGVALLQVEIRRNLIHGRLAQSIQFIQDLVAVAVLLALGAEAFTADAMAMQVGYGAFLLVAAFLFNRYVFSTMGRLAGDSEELMIVGVISMLVIFIGAAALADVSIVVGAFFAGVAVRHDRAEYLSLFNGLESIKDFFVAIFFATVGALIVIPFVEMGMVESIEKLLLAAGIVLLVVIVKPAITIGILITRGYEARTATLTAMSTDQVSEFSLIIAIQALLLEYLTQSVFDAIILAAAITMITSTITQRYDEQIYHVLANRGIISGRHDKIEQLSSVPPDISDHAIVVGYGRKGSRIVDRCEAVGHPYVVIENDPALRETVRSECEAYVFGDAMESFTWRKANVDEARVIVSATSSDAVTRRILDLETDAHLVLRAEDEDRALYLLEEGATYVTVPDLLAGEQLVELVKRLLDGELTAAELRENGLRSLKADRR